MLNHKHALKVYLFLVLTFIFFLIQYKFVLHVERCSLGYHIAMDIENNGSKI